MKEEDRMAPFLKKCCRRENRKKTKNPEWHRTCHTYFYRFHFNTEKGKRMET